MMILLIDLTPAIGPGYTLLAFVIVIVGGLGSMNGALLGGVLIGLSEALAGLFIVPSAKEHVQLRLADRRPAASSARSVRRQAVNRRASFLLVLLSAALIVLPAFADNYVLSVATLFLFFAYTGQAWNIMMGFAGQLSLGHAFYLGVGGYTAGGALFSLWRQSLDRRLARDRLFASPSALCSAPSPFVTASPAFTSRCLTIAFAEFARIGFDHFAWVGGSAGLFLKVGRAIGSIWLNLRGPPAMYYYVMLTACGVRFRTVRLAAAPPAGLLLASDPRERRSRERSRHRCISLENARRRLSARL